MDKRIIGFLIFLFLITIALTASGENNRLFLQNNIQNKTCLVRIYDIDQMDNLPRNIEIVGGKPDKWVDILIAEKQLNDLSDIKNSVIIKDIDSYNQLFEGQYHSLAEIEQILFGIAEAYPNITSLYSIGQTIHGRDIWCLEITDNPGTDEGEPGVFYMGLHHAREWPSVEICLKIADELTSNYGFDLNITNLVDNRRLWLVPCVNPDGYYYCYDEGNDWRKNRFYFTEFGTYGVDVNRNYDGSVNGDIWGAWGSLGISSVEHNPSSSIYCGPYPMSELETQAICNLFIENDICASITWHTYGELVLWPWSYSETEITADNEYMSFVGQELASKIKTQNGEETYTPTQSSNLYPTTGDTTDWAYGYYHYILGKPLFSYTIEAGLDYHPAEDHLDQICEENFKGALYLLQEAENIKNTVIPRVIPPKINDIIPDENGYYTISWQEQNSLANPNYFQLEELANITIFSDDAESSESIWALDGFSKSNIRYYSGSQSYKSPNALSDVSSMKTIYPIPISSGDELSFWCWYRTERFYDFAMVEISRNGREYDVLETFNGDSNGWQHKVYNLSEYVGDSIFIRFRSTTDEATTFGGFYVDDIYPIANFDTITTLSDSITDNYYEITGKPNGTYYYKIRGYNDEHGWGDFSPLKEVLVGEFQDTNKPIVQITYPKLFRLYIKNIDIFPFITTLIFDDIDIDVYAHDKSGIKRVEFYIDDILVCVDTTAPYTFNWDQMTFFKHIIKAKVYDVFNNISEKEIIVWRFF